MTEHWGMLVQVFRLGSIALGVPSLMGAFGFGFLSLVMWLERPQTSGRTDPRASESLVNVVVVMASWVGKVLGALLGLLEGMVHLAAYISLALFILAVGMYLTSRGLAANAIWARWVAGFLMIVLLLIGGLGSLTSGAGMFRLVGLGMVWLSSYSLWMIWRGMA